MRGHKARTRSGARDTLEFASTKFRYHGKGYETHERSFGTQLI